MLAFCLCFLEEYCLETFKNNEVNFSSVWILFTLDIRIILSVMKISKYFGRSF